MTKSTEIVLMRGLPGSGKTTAAKAWVKESFDWRLRISPDDIGSSLYGKLGAVSHHQKQTVALMEEAQATAALNASISVVVDAIHLSADSVKRWYNFGNHIGVPVVVYNVEEDLELCVKRSQNYTEGQVRDLYNRFFKKGKLPKLPLNDVKTVAGQAYERNPELPRAVWVDVDGTLAERVHPLAPQPVRGPFDEARVMEDAVIEHIADLVRILHAAGFKIVIMSGRSDFCKDLTEQWLIEHAIPYDDIFMRKSGDDRKDSVVKEELFWENVAPKYDVWYALDDRQQVVDHTREVLKIPVLQVAPGLF